MKLIVSFHPFLKYSHSSFPDILSNDSAMLSIAHRNLSHAGFSSSIILPTPPRLFPVFLFLLLILEGIHQIYLTLLFPQKTNHSIVYQFRF